MFTNRPNRAVVTILMFVLSSVAMMGAEPSENREKVNREIEVMESILRTTLELAEKDVRSEMREGEEDTWRSAVTFFPEEGRSEVEGFFLTDQGVVFTLSVPAFDRSGLRLQRLEEQIVQFQEQSQRNPEMFEVQVEMIKNQMEMTRRQIEQEALEAELADKGRVLFAPAPPSPPRVVAEPAPSSGISEEERQARSERIQRRLAEAQSELDDAKEKLQQRRQRTERIRERIREELLEAVSRHGDSLTELQPQHYVNLILVSQDRLGSYLRVGSEERTVISIKKGDILDFKSGRIDYPTFLSRVVEY